MNQSKLLANNVDPDQMPLFVASYLGLHCLPMTLLWVLGKNGLKVVPVKKEHTFSWIRVSCCITILIIMFSLQLSGTEQWLHYGALCICPQSEWAPLKVCLHILKIRIWYYRKNFKYWDMYVWANSVDSDQTALKEQSDQDLHCLPFFLHLLEALLPCKIKLFYIKDNYGSWSGCPNI